MKRFLQSKLFEDIEIGSVVKLTKILQKEDINNIYNISPDEGNKNDLTLSCLPLSMWISSIVASMIEFNIPGPGTFCKKYDISFTDELKNLKIDDFVNFTITVKDKNKEKNEIEINISCFNKDENIIAYGAIIAQPHETRVRSETHGLPRIEIVEDKLSYGYQALMTSVKRYKPIKAAVVHPLDQSSLEGAIEAANEKIIIPVLIGPETKIKEVAQANNIDISNFEIIHTDYSHESAEKSCLLARDGEVECIIKGKLHTDELLRPVLNKDFKLRTNRRLSHVFLLIAPNYHKPLMLTDAAINIYPNLIDKVDIVQNAIDLFVTIFAKKPKVALLSAVETVTASMQSTLDATALCKMSDRGQILYGILDGPLAFDNAISKEAAIIKGIDSIVSGDVDILMVPNIEAGNILYKEMRYLSHAEGAGIVLGAKIPIVLTSRSEGSIMARKASCALAQIFSNRKDNIASLINESLQAK